MSKYFQCLCIFQCGIKKRGESIKDPSNNVKNVKTLVCSVFQKLKENAKSQRMFFDTQRVSLDFDFSFNSVLIHTHVYMCVYKSLHLMYLMYFHEKFQPGLSIL